MTWWQWTDIPNPVVSRSKKTMILSSAICKNDIWTWVNTLYCLICLSKHCTRTKKVCTHSPRTVAVSAERCRSHVSRSAGVIAVYQAVGGADRWITATSFHNLHTLLSFKWKRNSFVSFFFFFSWSASLLGSAALSDHMSTKVTVGNKRCFFCTGGNFPAVRLVSLLTRRVTERRAERRGCWDGVGDNLHTFKQKYKTDIAPPKKIRFLILTK